MPTPLENYGYVTLHSVNVPGAGNQHILYKRDTEEIYVQRADGSLKIIGTSDLFAGSSNTPININAFTLIVGSTVTLTTSPYLYYFPGNKVVIQNDENIWIKGDVVSYNYNTGQLTITVTATKGMYLHGIFFNSTTAVPGIYTNVASTAVAPSGGIGSIFNIEIAINPVTSLPYLENIELTNPGSGYSIGDRTVIPGTSIGASSAEFISIGVMDLEISQWRTNIEIIDRPVSIQYQGVTITTAVSNINFTGTGITATATGNNVTVVFDSGSSGTGPTGPTGPSGYTEFYYQPSRPIPDPTTLGARWLDNDNGIEYVWVFDGASYLWMQPTQIGNVIYQATSINTPTYLTTFAYEYYGVIYTGGVCSVTLPAGTIGDEGRFITIADEVGGISNGNRGIQVQGSGGQLINGSTSILMKLERMSLTFLYRNNEWKTI